MIRVVDSVSPEAHEATSAFSRAVFNLRCFRASVISSVSARKVRVGVADASTVFGF
jgi:hypothetical protein